MGLLKDKYFHVKPPSYMDVYENKLEKYRNRPIWFVEVGVDRGQSLEMWAEYFHPESKIIGVDIAKSCAEIQFSHPNIEVIIGDQTDKLFWEGFFARYEADVCVEDGGHEMFHQRLCFENVFPHLKMGGTYITEDTTTSYMPGHYHNPVPGNPENYLEYAKSYVDLLLEIYHKRFPPEGEMKRKAEISKGLSGISFYESMIVFEKNGIPSFNQWRIDQGYGPLY